ncbi:hypothetical protein VNO78_02228 [Psophocarpus tetragonolobus]|uniref:Small auxin up regulated protein n=1 Tax=Psophocarpus tetragonolobus TaxID=3891 RepID=A0AAN9XVJ6_PSOTE
MNRLNIWILEVITNLACPGEFKNIAKMPKYLQGEQEMRKAPKGQFVVYVGKELRRFTLPLSYLKNPTFQKLLKKSAEEYGYSNSRGIVLPCDQSTFETFINSSNLRI